MKMQMCGKREKHIDSDNLAEDNNCGAEGWERADIQKDLQSNHPAIWKLVGFTLIFF